MSTGPTVAVAKGKIKIQKKKFYFASVILYIG